MVNGSNTRNGRRGRRNNRRSNSAVTHAQLKRENHLLENGCKLKPGPHPTAFLSIPWFPLTIRVENFTTLAFGTSSSTIASVIDVIKSQLNLPTATTVEFRIQSVRIWGPIVPMNSSTALQPLRAQFWSLVEIAGTSSGTSFAILEDCFAYPDQVSRASLGFMWPKAQQAVALQQQTNGILVNLTSGGGTGVVAYVRLLWRPRPAFSTDTLLLEAMAIK